MSIARHQQEHGYPNPLLRQGLGLFMLSSQEDWRFLERHRILHAYAGSQDDSRE
jgi:hypothetical protein